MKKFLVVLMMVLSMVTFGKTFKEAMNEDLTSNVWIAGAIDDNGTIKYIVTDGTWMGFLAVNSNDTNVILKSNDPTALSGAGKRKFDGWFKSYDVERYVYEQAARGNYIALPLDEYRAYIRKNGKKSAQKSRL